MDKRYFSEKLAEWYHENKRSLPWRDTDDPYKIWLSEIILQQTRVSQGLPYYLRFIEKYPTVHALADAAEQEVLRLWQGLGYYTRARNLHKCAKTIVNDHSGVFPEHYEGLRKLPGIGDYTAAAIASISFQEPVAVVDGNVYRVLSRVFGIDTAINSPEGKKKFTQLANELLQTRQPNLHNQAVMEFGALYCTPKGPNCAQCVLKSTCFARRHQLQQQLPVKNKLKSSRKRYFYYFVLQHRKSLALKKRDQKDIWQGLFDFHLIEKNKPVKIEKLIAEYGHKNWPNKNPKVDVSPPYKHVLTHQTITARFIRVEIDKSFQSLDERLKFYSAKQIGSLPKPVLITRFLEEQQLL